MSLRFSQIDFAYAGQSVLSGIELEAHAGEITCLLGVSGCGKTTLLKLAAGLLPVQSGTIELDGQTLASKRRNPPPEKRPVGLIFQEGALFPHMTVGNNVAFGLKKNGRSKSEVISELLDHVGLSGMADRYPHTLSGGQQQRVALARALAPAPRVLLLDEPFANVDIVLRRQLRLMTRRVLKARDTIAVLVTHDPQEAMDIADRIVVMGQGRVLQVGTPQEIYDTPVSAEVGALFGHGQLIPAKRRNGSLYTSFGPWSVDSIQGVVEGGESYDVLVRPDWIDVDLDGEDAVIEDIRPAGSRQTIIVTSSDQKRLQIDLPRDRSISVGKPIGIRMKPGSVIAFPKTDSH